MEKINIHIDSNQKLTILEFSKIISAISESFNLISKEQHLSTRDYNKQSPIISAVRNGSILIEILIDASIQIVATVIGGVLLEKIKTKLNKKRIQTEIDEKAKTIEIEVIDDEKNGM